MTADGPREETGLPDTPVPYWPSLYGPARKCTAVTDGDIGPVDLAEAAMRP